MIRAELSRAIHRAGAFRNFKDTVRRLGIESAWFACRAEALRKIALDWCEKNQIQLQAKTERTWVCIYVFGL